MKKILSFEQTLTRVVNISFKFGEWRWNSVSVKDIENAIEYEEDEIKVKRYDI